jgi:hypothetical protein
VGSNHGLGIAGKFSAATGTQDAGPPAPSEGCRFCVRDGSGIAATAIAFTTMPVLLGARSAQAGKTVLIDTVLPGDELVDRELWGTVPS